MKSRLALAVAFVLLTACSQGTQSSGKAGSPAPTATNNTNFPLLDGATVLSAHGWRQIVSSGSAQSHPGMFSQGSGTYVGHDTIAQTPASLTDVEAWLHGLAAKPPKDFQVLATGSGVDEARQRAQAIGIDFNAFQHTINGKTQGVVVIVIDPATLNAKAGVFLGMIDKYKMLPPSLRDMIDAQAKARTGYSVSDALDPNSPLGAALGALSQLTASGDRGIVVVDATKT